MCFYYRHKDENIMKDLTVVDKLFFCVRGMALLRDMWNAPPCTTDQRCGGDDGEWHEKYMLDIVLASWPSKIAKEKQRQVSWKYSNPHSSILIRIRYTTRDDEETTYWGGRVYFMMAFKQSTWLSWYQREQWWHEPWRLACDLRCCHFDANLHHCLKI